MDSLAFVLQVHILFHLYSSSFSQFIPQSPYSFASQGMPGMTGMMPMSIGNPFQRSMPMMSMPGQRMPSVIMPYHSKSFDKHRQTKKNKHRRSHKHRRDQSSENGDTSSSSDSDYRRSNPNSGRSNKLQNVGKQLQRQVLTPIVSYITKDGYIVYQKKITKKNPYDWLNVGRGEKSLPASLEEIVDDTHEDDRKVKIFERSRTTARKLSHTRNFY